MNSTNTHCLLNITHTHTPHPVFASSYLSKGKTDDSQSPECLAHIVVAVLF